MRGSQLSLLERGGAASAPPGPPPPLHRSESGSTASLLETTYETHAGARLRVARLGAGPRVILLHGYPDNLQIFCALAPRLASAHEVVAFDWPGMGRSEAWPGGTTVFHQAERLASLLEAWGPEPATLVGLDMGAQPALALAAQRPDLVARLVVLGTLAWPAAPTSWEIRLLRRTRLNVRLLRFTPGLVFERAVRTCLPPGMRLPRELRDDLWGAFRQPEVRRFVSRLCGGYQGSLPRLPQLYGAIRCPTLVLWGARDRHFPVVQGKALAAAIPGARLEVLPHGEHWMAWHAAEHVADGVRSCIDTCQYKT